MLFADELSEIYMIGLTYVSILLVCFYLEFISGVYNKKETFCIRSDQRSTK